MPYLGALHTFFADVLTSDFRADIFDLVETAWPRITDPTDAWLEPRITGLLRTAMISEQEAKYSRNSPFFILEEVKKRDPISGKEIERSDIEIHLRHFYITGQKPYFVFESKRLNIPYDTGVASNVGEYVGSSGMGCLVNGQYQSAPSLSGMLGYVMNGDVKSARSAIDNALKKNAAVLHLCKCSNLQVPKSIPAGKHRNETLHLGLEGEYAIFHLFLPINKSV